MRNANSIGLKPISNVASIPNPAEAELPPEEERVVDRSIGSYLQELRQLDDEQIAAILTHHRSKGMRFGEAAVALRMASREDVLWALSQQFHYPYASGDGKRFHEELVAAIDPFDAQTEALRGVRSQLMLGVMASDQPARALSVLSPNVGDGRSFFAANLAIVFSQLGERTLLIDADMRKPKQHLLFGVPNQSGLSNMLLGRPESSVIHRVPDLPSLFVLPVGTVPPNPLELLQRPAFKLLMQELLKKFDHVVVDTPPNTQGADARVVAAQCGIALVLGRRGATRMKAVSSLINDVARGPATVAGVVINEH